jgi:N-methylhydantoinase A
MTYRLGVDVGGTFTDLLLINESTGQTWRAKVPSTPADQSAGVLAGLGKLCAAAGLDPAAIGSVLHGTTVATNAVLEGRGARVGLLVTEGYRQVLQVARSFVPGGLGGWIIWPKPEPLAALEDTREIAERVGARGQVLRPLDEDTARAALRSLRGTEALTISLINSFADDGHERRLAELAAEELPGVPVSLSSRILPEIREYERTLTTVANGYVRPVVERYLTSLDSALRERGMAGSLYVLRSDGGLTGVEAAAQAPVTMLMSGPAGGVAGAVWAAQRSGFGNLLTLDMGGTSTDVALVQDGKPRIGRETAVGDLTVRASSIDVRTVGAGGGSIAHVPELTRALRVGPQSAGAEPGPAAYGLGGTQPTVTDANVVLGYLPPALLGGEMTLDADAARAAVEQVATAMGLSAEEAAAGIIDIVNENMVGALRLVSVRQGYDPREFALVAFGGAGPLHANALGRIMGSWPVIIPPSPGVLCAYGDATTSLRGESARTYIRRFSETSPAEIRAELAELAGQARAGLDAEGVPRDSQVIAHQVDVRYHGQGFELAVDLDVAELADAEAGLAAIGQRFDTEHEKLFTFSLDVEHELVNLRAIATAPRPEVAQRRATAGDPDPSAARVGTVPIWAGDGFTDAAHYDRSALACGHVVAGPAVITEMDSTTLVLPGHHATVDAAGALLIRPSED